MAHRTAGSREEWQEENSQQLEREKELERLSEELTKERRALPWLRIDKEYTVEADEGPKTLPELFDGRSQLLIYHIMFGPSWTAACPACSQLADQFDGMLTHLNARDVTLLCVSHAPIEKLQAYKRRMGWQYPLPRRFAAISTTTSSPPSPRISNRRSPSRCSLCLLATRPKRRWRLRAGSTWRNTSQPRRQA